VKLQLVGSRLRRDRALSGQRHVADSPHQASLAPEGLVDRLDRNLRLRRDRGDCRRGESAAQEQSPGRLDDRRVSAAPARQLAESYRRSDRSYIPIHSHVSITGVYQILGEQHGTRELTAGRGDGRAAVPRYQRS
jgi:hypothetical protein